MKPVWILLLALIILCAPRAAEAEPITLFGAASLSDALEDIARRYAEESGETIQFSFAASSTLARQIEAGAPAQIFASASVAWMDYLDDRGFLAPGSRASPIANRLVLVAPAGTAPDPAPITAALDLPALLGRGGRLAIGDPEHVPAGIYAAEALRNLGLWSALENRLAYAGDVRAVLALVERGEAPLGIVYATDAALSPRVRIVGVFPDRTHRPIVYAFAIVAGQDDERVSRFFRYITGDSGRAVFGCHGFVLN